MEMDQVVESWKHLFLPYCSMDLSSMEQYATAETWKNGNLRSKHYDELSKREFLKGDREIPITHYIKP